MQISERKHVNLCQKTVENNFCKNLCKKLLKIISPERSTTEGKDVPFGRTIDPLVNS